MSIDQADVTQTGSLMTGEQLQKYWDASLIASWRRSQHLLAAILRWEHLTGRRFTDVLGQLRRAPRPNMPWKIGVRVFVAEYLPKISDRLWNQAPEKDVLLLRKLQTSTYDTMRTAMPTQGLRDINNKRRQARKAGSEVVWETNQYLQRNSATDWNVTKGSRRMTGGRG